MTTGRILLTGLLALAFAVGASSTAHARSSYSFSINSGPGWGHPGWGGYSHYGYRPASYGYVVGPAYHVPPPPPPVYWGHPRYYGARSGYSFSYYGY